jgi:hypothetical protein
MRDAGEEEWFDWLDGERRRWGLAFRALDLLALPFFFGMWFVCKRRIYLRLPLLLTFILPLLVLRNLVGLLTFILSLLVLRNLVGNQAPLDEELEEERYAGRGGGGVDMEPKTGFVGCSREYVQKGHLGFLSWR